MEIGNKVFEAPVKNSDGARKKVLIAITKSNLGGAQKYVFELAARLPKKTFEVSVLLGGDGPLATELLKPGIKIISLKKLRRDVSLSDFFAPFRFIKIFIREKPDIIHLNSSKAGGLGAFSGRLVNGLFHIRNFLLSILKRIFPKWDKIASSLPRKRIKTIFTAHGWAFNESRPLIPRMCIKFLQWLTVMLAEKTVAVSEKTAKNMSRMPFSRKKISVIRNGVPAVKFLAREVARDEIVSRKQGVMRFAVPAKKGEEVFWIGTLAELHKNKGLEYAIKAAAQVRQLLVGSRKRAIFIVAGEGEESENLEALIKEKKLEDCFFLVGEIKNGAEFLRAFDVFFMSSTTEGLPYALLEAGMASLPAIATNVGGIPEIIDDMRSGIIIRNRHYKDLAYGIRHLIENRGEAVEFGKRLRETVSQKFSVDKMVEETAKEYL